MIKSLQAIFLHLLKFPDKIIKGDYVLKAMQAQLDNELINDAATLSSANAYTDSKKIPLPIRLTSVDFTDGVYQNNALIGMTAQSSFDLFSASGTGGLLNEGIDAGGAYDFDSMTGSITATPAKYSIMFH